MAGHQYQLIFNCTPTQLETALLTTLPAASYTVTRMPIKFTGIIVSTTYGQVDWSYDGQYFLTFFGANVRPVAQQTNAGIQDHQLGPNLVANLTSTLAGTLGAPVPPNLAVPPSFVP